MAALVLCAASSAGVAGQERNDQPAAGPQPASNARMAERLEALAAARIAELRSDRDNAARLAALRALPPFPDAADRWIHEASIAGELLRAGRTAEAIAAFERLRQRLAANPADAPAQLPAFPQEMRRSLAIAYAQRAQEENCLHPRAARACAVPLPPGLAHRRPEAARRAVALYEEMAAEAPDDLVVRWMLDLARHWAGRPEDDAAYGGRREIAGFSEFPDIAPQLGVDVVGPAGGSVMEDFDADGDLDILASSWGQRDPLRFLRNDGGAFVDATEAAGLAGIVGGLNLSSADYDNDGLPDVLVLRGAWTPDPVPNSLLRSHGDGTFTDVTEAAGLLHAAPTQTGVWGDYDNDGDLDLFLGNESPPGAHWPTELYANDGAGAFTEVAAAAGVQVVGMVKGAAWGDYDNDGRLDLFVSILGAPNRLFRNEGPAPGGGPWRFRDVTAAAGVAAPDNSFPTWFFDYDNDGWLDLFVAGYRAFLGDVAAEALGRPLVIGQGYPVLYRNRGDGTFVDVTHAVGLRTIMPVMGSNFGDLDNDGFPDLYLGTGAPGLEMLVPNRVFRNAGGARFEEVTAAGGFGHLQKGHAVSFGDVDHDGDQDVHVVLGGYYEGDVSRNVLLRNPGHGAAWVTLRLEGVAANRFAVGARIALAVDTPDGARVVHATAGTGGSFGASSLQQEIGLGRATRIRRLTIDWPGSGHRDTYRDPPLDRILHLREGAPAVTVVPAAPLDLEGKP